MTVDTYVSRNIPASHNLYFLERRAEREEGRFDEETAKPYDPADFFSIDEHIVDNEDEGFQILSTEKESWLSRALQKLFGKSGGESSFTGMNVYNPPASWKLSPNPEFYGRFVRSAYLKKSGDGEDKAAWNVELDEAGSYDVYFFFGRSVGMQKMRMEASARKGADSKSGLRGRFNLGPGKKYFLVSNRFGVEEVVIDLENAEEGWNLIGTFELDAGPNRIEQTDRSDVGYVLADAVKWVKK
jgi:hypothetical protein